MKPNIKRKNIRNKTKYNKKDKTIIIFKFDLIKNISKI